MSRNNAVSDFLQITGIECKETARLYLKAKNWRLDEALNMFYVRSESRSTAPAAIQPTGWDDDDDDVGVYSDQVQHSGHYDDYTSHRLEPEEPDVSKNKTWESNERGDSKPNASGDTLAHLYRQPFSLMYGGSFEKAKAKASFRNKWLIVNLQSNKEFNSHLLNRDTWSNETVEETIRSNFVFWQVYNDKEEGKKVCTYYKVMRLPTVLILDPITGQKRHEWNGMLQPNDLLEVLSSYMESGPKEILLSSNSQKRSKEIAENSNTYIKVEEDDMSGDGDSLADTTEYSEDSKDETAEYLDSASPEDTEQDLEDAILSVAGETDSKPVYLPLPEEPEVSKELICRVGIRLPDGRRLQRNFLRTDPIKLLWSFCCSQMEERETMKAFVFTQAMPGAACKSLVSGSNLTFEEADLRNSLLSLVWL